MGGEGNNPSPPRKKGEEQNMYKIIKSRLIVLKDGTSVEQVGDTFGKDDVSSEVSVSALVKRGFIEQTSVAKVTKEVVAKRLPKRAKKDDD